MKLRTVSFIVAVLALILTGCGGDEQPAAPAPPPAPPRLSIVATNAIVGDFVQVLTGGTAEVTVLSPGDPHSFEPGPQNLTDLANADIIFRSGAGLEPWLDDSLDDSSSAGTVIDAGAGVQVRRELFNGVSQVDPHIWMSPVNARLMVANIANGLVTVGRMNETLIRSTERAYYSQLDNLSNSIRNSLGSLNNRKLVTGHRSMGYFASEFQLTYVGSAVPSYDSSARPDEAYSAQLLNRITSEKVTVLFGENGSASSYMLADIADEAKIKLAIDGNGIYVDSLGPSGGPADSYLKMMRQNTANLVRNLG